MIDDLITDLTTIHSEVMQKLTPKNIKKNTTILGVTGSNSVVDTSDANATTSDLLKDKTAYVNGEKVTGTIRNAGTITIPCSQYSSYSFTNAYFEGLTIPPVTSAVDENITAENIKNGVEILGVTGTLEGLKGETKTVTPTTSNQIIRPSTGKNGMTQVTVTAVTSSIDANITAGNIKSGVQILGVTGTYEGGPGKYWEIKSYNGMMMNGLFAFLPSLSDTNKTAAIDYIENYSTTGITSLNHCFYQAVMGDVNLDLTGWDVSNVSTFEHMFEYWYGLKSVDMSNWDMTSGKYFSEMFMYCSGLTSLDLSGWTFQQTGVRFGNFASYASSLESVDFRNCNTENINYWYNAFEGCSALTTIYGVIDLINCTDTYSVYGIFGSPYTTNNTLTTVQFKNLNASGVLNLTSYVALSHDSLMYLINNLIETQTAKSVTLGNTNLAKLTQSEIAIATAKGWTLA